MIFIFQLITLVHLNFITNLSIFRFHCWQAEFVIRSFQLDLILMNNPFLSFSPAAFFQLKIGIVPYRRNDSNTKGRFVCPFYSSVLYNPILAVQSFRAFIESKSTTSDSTFLSTLNVKALPSWKLWMQLMVSFIIMASCSFNFLFKMLIDFLNFRCFLGSFLFLTRFFFLCFVFLKLYSTASSNEKGKCNRFIDHIY